MRSTKTTSTTTTASASQATERAPRGDSVNEVTLIGRLVAPAEMRETGSGKHVTTVRIATNGANGQAEFHSVVLWGQLADFAVRYLGKGRLVYVAGRLQTRTWDAADGSTRRAVEVVANRLQALSCRESTGSAA